MAARELARRPSAAGLSHLEGSPVARNSDHDHIRRDTCLGNYEQRLFRLGDVHVGAESVPYGAARRGPFVAVVPLTLQVICHVKDVVNIGPYFLYGKGFEVPI